MEKVYTAKCVVCVRETSGIRTGTPVIIMTQYGIALEALCDYLNSFVTTGNSMFEYHKMWL